MLVEWRINNVICYAEPGTKKIQVDLYVCTFKKRGYYLSNQAKRYLKN